MPKHEGQATVASREPQYMHSAASVDVAAPHIGQLSVSACISGILAGGVDAGLWVDACAMLAARHRPRENEFYAKTSDRFVYRINGAAIRPC